MEDKNVFLFREPELKYYKGKPRWFIVSYERKAGPGLGIGPCYLHSDGIARKTTQNRETGIYTGWFESLSEARQVLTEYRDKNEAW